MKKIPCALLVWILFSLSTNAQLFDSDVYKVNPWVDGAITLAATGTNYLGMRMVDRKEPLDSIDIMLLDANDINAFDRSATRQDASYIRKAWQLSDYGMNGSFLLPLLLMLDRDIRQDWAPVLMLYLQSEAVVGNLFSWGAAIHIDRIRPLVYHPDVSYEDKVFKRNKNSFYSGHTSTSATASFFVAKVYCDYHPELGNKKFLFYGLALIPPVFTGYHRYKGMKHFPTDVLTGLAVGASVGILIPHLHKISRPNLSVLPFAGNVSGLALSYTF